MSIINIRELILEILIRVEKQNAYLNILVPYYLNQYALKYEDKGLIQEIAYGVTRYRKKLDWMIDQHLKSQNKKLPLIIRNILRMGVYQILYLDKIPNYAICHESVELAKKNKNYSGYSGFLNAVLRNIIRHANQLDWPNIHQDPVKYVSVYYSFSEWLVRRWIERFGLDLCIRFCQASNQRPDLTFRINSLKTDISAFKKKLSKLGISFKGGNYTPMKSVIVKDFVGIDCSKIFIDGFFSIQDESSILASMLLNPNPGELIIDMCSGPGGKTTHLAQLMCNQGEIIAFDINKKRLRMVRDECERLGIHIVRTILHDASQFSELYYEKADKIIVDVPCSGTGVIRKKPDLKWKKLGNSRLKKINHLQEVILDVASHYLKPGGEMVYTTCSVEKEENDEIIKKFLKKRKEFKALETVNFVQTNNLIKWGTEITQAIQLVPGYSGDEIDGFYMVKIKKTVRKMDNG